MAIPSDNPKIVYGPAAMGTVTATKGTVSLGAELVTNGTFTGAATGWTLGTGWAYETNDVRHTAGNTATMTQALSLTAGYRYEVVFTVAGRTAGSVTVSVGGTAGTARSADGTFTERLLTTATTALTFTPTSDFDGDIDTVSVKRCGLDNATYTFVVRPLAVRDSTTMYATQSSNASATTDAGAGLGSVSLSWSAVEHAEGYQVYEVDTSPNPDTYKLRATYSGGAWDFGTGTATTWTVQESDVSSATTLSAMISPVTMWLPKKFVNNWEPRPTRQPEMQKGLCYTQVTSYPILYEVSNKTAVWDDSMSEDFDGSGAEGFRTTWKRFWEGWGSVGKVWQFYRKATDSTAGWSYFSRCVWTRRDDGITQMKGRPRYDLDFEFRTEGAAR